MIQSKVLFTVAEDEKLVELVAKFPCIFDPANPLYKIQSLKDQSWSDISDYVERSVEDCKKRWRNIKDTYLKREKRRKEHGFSASTKVKKWPLANMLLFLRNVEYRSQSNIQTDDTSTQEDVSEVDEDTSPSTESNNAPTSSEKSTSSTSKPSADFLSLNKRQKPNEVKQLTEDNSSERNESDSAQDRDDVNLFFKSIATSVKKLPPELINEAKMKSLQMVFDLESRNAMYSASQSSSSFGISSTGTNRNNDPDADYQDEIGNVFSLSAMPDDEMVTFAKSVTSQMKLLPVSFGRPLLQNIQTLVDNKAGGDSFILDLRELSSDFEGAFVKSELDIEEYKMEV